MWDRHPRPGHTACCSDGTVKDIVVFDEADADANTPPSIVLEAGKTTTLNIIYTQSMAAKASVKDWDKGTEHTFQ